MPGKEQNPRLHHPLFIAAIGTALALAAVPAAPAQDLEAPPPSPASAPATSRPRQPSHEELVQAASQRPLLVVALTREDGSPLTEDHKSKIRRAEELTAAARASRLAGNFLKGRQEAQEALDLYVEILGSAHYLSAGASVLLVSLEGCVTAEASAKSEIMEADRLVQSAAAALKESRFPEARTAARKAIEIRERVFGKENFELIEPLRIVGACQTELRALDDAESELDRAQAIAERTYGKSHPTTAAILDRIGWRHIYAGKTTEAEQALRRALFIYNSTVGETPETAETMDNLGTAVGSVSYADVGEAANLKLRALVIRRQLLGPSAKDTAVSMSNLAWLYSRVGSMSGEVIPLRRQALEIFVHTLGPDHRETVVEKSNLASAYRRNGQQDEALALYLSLVTDDEKSGKPPDQNVINHLTMVGTLYLETGKQSDGEKMLQKAFEKCLALHDKGEVGAAVAEMEQLAMAYHSRHMLDDAYTVRMKVWEWDQATHARVNEVLVRRCIQLGRLCCDVGRPKEAVQVMRRTVRDAGDLYGKEEREMVVPLLGLATALLEAGEPDEASSVCGEAMRVAERKHPRGSVSNAYAIDAMGMVQMAQKSYDLARFSFEEAKSILDNARAPDEIKKVAVARNHCKCLLQLGEIDKAVRIMREAMAWVRESRHPYPMQLKTMKANTIRQLMLALDRDPSAEASERTELKQELRTLLEELRDGRALTAEMKEWLKEMGLSESRGA